MDLVRKLLMSPMSRKKNANNSNKRLSMPVCSSQATNIPLKSRNRDMSHNQSSVSISLHQSSTSILSNSSGELKYFGEPLQDILARERGKVPRLVVAASQFICDKGLQQEGLFRVSGNARAIENLKMAIGKTGDVVIGNHNEVGTVASLLKLFFRQLPDPLIPQDMTESFLRLISNDSYSTERCFRELRRLCEKLPPCNYTTLKYLVQLLVLVARHEKSNKMSPQALGIVFGPNIFRTNMKNQGLTNYIVTCFITGYDRIFRTSEEVFSVDAGEISHPNIMRPAPSRPRRYSHEEGLPPMQLNQEIKADDSSGKDDGDDEDDDDDDDDDVKGVLPPPSHRSAPPPTPRSLAGTTDMFSFDNCETSPKTSVINVDQLLGTEVQNDESQHSLRCLEEEISEVISSVLFPTGMIGDRRGSADSGVSHADGNRKENTGTLKKRKVKKTEQVMPHVIDSLPSNSLLKNYRRPQGPKNRRLPSTQLLKSSAGNTTPGTPRRCLPKANQEKSNLSGDRNQIRKSPEISENPLIATPSLSGHKKATSIKSINQMSVKGVKVKEAPVKVGQLDRQRSINKKWTTALSWNSGNEVTNGTMADRDRSGGNNGDEFLKRNLKLVHKVDSIFQEKAEFIPKRKVLTPGIRHSIQCQRSSLRNNNNTESFNADANNSCTCGIDDDDGDGNDERGKEEAMQNVADGEEQRDHESEVENVSVSHETVENFKLPSIGNDPSAFGSTSFCPKQKVEASEDESPKELPQENPVDPASPIKNPISEDGDLPTTGDDANDSAAECLSLVMNLSQPSLGDAENADNNVDDFNMRKTKEHARRGSKHFSCDRKSDSADDEDEDGVKPDPFKGHISSMEVQDVTSKRQSLTSLDKLTNYSSNESQASVEEQIQECVADLQRFRDSLRILEEKYIARYNQKPSKIARMIDKDMSYYESQIKRCRIMLRKLRKLKQQLPHPLPELLSSSQVKPSQSTQRSVNPDEEVDDDAGVERDTSDRYVSTDCGDLQKKKEKIEMLRSQLFHQQQFSPHSSPKTHRARKMSVSSPGVGGVDRPGNQSRREGTKSLSPSRHLLHDSTQQPHHHRHRHQQQLDEGDLSRFQLIQSTDHHHHHDQQKQQQQLPMDSPPQHKRQILLQPISQELPDELKEMKTSMDNLERELEQMRIADNRNFSINLMTREELKKEKTDMQKALLKFESTFGRPTSRMEKSLVKSIYARYSEVKKELRRFDESSRVSPVEVKTPMSTKSHGSNAKVTPFPELEEENKNIRANDGGCDDADANSSLTEKNSLEDLEIMLDKFSLGQLVDERMRLANMKMKLSTELKTFEREFIKFNGREMQKTEKLLKQDEYTQLKELKAHLRLVENLIDKKWKCEQNRNK